MLNQITQLLGAKARSFDHSGEAAVTPDYSGRHAMRNRGFFGPIYKTEDACGFANLIYGSGEESPGFAIGSVTVCIFREGGGRIVLRIDGDGKKLEIGSVKFAGDVSEIRGE